MNSAPAIALYLGESYASLGAFDLSQRLPTELFEKTVFLPQISFKNLLNQAKQNLSDTLADAPEETKPVRFFIVTKYLDRLKNFRLGGSVAQVVSAGYENSYAAMNTKSLSLAAASLVISVTPENLSHDLLTEELARIKKVNPDTNKVAIQLSTAKFSSAQIEMVTTFFTAAEFKVFSCHEPENLGQVRRTLLNAGTEGTKEEILSEIKEIFGEKTEIYFWCDQGFKKDFENYELFASHSSFLAALAIEDQVDLAAYFDHEGFRIIQTKPRNHWQSPWGSIPSKHYEYKELVPHPFSEVRLDHLSMLSISSQPTQHEPGPICAGRGIKPLVIDLLIEDAGNHPFLKSLFTHLNADGQKQKLQNHLSVLEKGQATNKLATTRAEMKAEMITFFQHEMDVLAQDRKIEVTGPLGSLFNTKAKKFHWPLKIIQRGIQ